MWKTLKEVTFDILVKTGIKYTKDKYILNIITNSLKLDLKELPTQNGRSSYPLSSKENEVISVETTN